MPAPLGVYAGRSRPAPSAALAACGVENRRLLHGNISDFTTITSFPLASGTGFLQVGARVLTDRAQVAGLRQIPRQL